ncbi:hypothetical protein UFOVP53_234 [uncultured Caudovirales phage]|uniref:Uncharacterized protein n=1 Tax=uncultured Caudovirales phage TaxID=2100421 RepID=A0A6J5L0B4_9CAUD|nr:hypothetical protein UFOVP53_234 [uncultured Caudovirales phage]
MSKKTIDLNELPVSEKIKIATELGEEAGKIMEAALKKANNKLKKYGYTMSVDLKFHELEKEVAN